MNVFVLWNLLLALTWAMATGEFTMGNLLVGMVLGYVCLSFARRAKPINRGERTRATFLGSLARVPRLIIFVIVYFWNLILANLRVAYDVMTPHHYMQPGVIGVRLDAHTDTEITLLANLLTLTPGTLSLDLSDDRRVLYVHSMYIDEQDVERARRAIKNRVERRVLRVLR